MVPGNVALLETAQGAWVSQALYVAAKLGSPTSWPTARRPRTRWPPRSARDPDSLFRLMRMLAGRSVFSHAPTAGSN